VSGGHQSFATRICSDLFGREQLTTSGSGPLNRHAQIRKNLVERDRAAAVALRDRVEEHLLGCFVNLEGLLRITNDQSDQGGPDEMRVDRAR
jgi:hypothetical protein